MLHSSAANNNNGSDARSGCSAPMDIDNVTAAVGHTHSATVPTGICVIFSFQYNSTGFRLYTLPTLCDKTETKLITPIIFKVNYCLLLRVSAY